MTEESLSIPGERVAPDALKIKKARAVASFLLSKIHPWAKLVECLSTDGSETVVIELSVEVGQAPVHAIQPIERIAAIFDDADQKCPEVLSLRASFPRVPHLNAKEHEIPRSLCLYEERYDDLKLGWTAPSFIERIRMWLRETAKGTLHQEDQPLEPILTSGNIHLVLPADLFSTIQSGAPDKLEIARCEPGPNGEVLIAERAGNHLGKPRGHPTVATTFACQPQTHGVIRFLPRNLAQLHEITSSAGLDLVSELRNRLDTWERDKAPLDSLLIVIVFFPKTRTVGGAIESVDSWAFLTPQTIRELGERLGLWQLQNGFTGRLLVPGQAHPETILFDVLNPTFALSRKSAAALNGFSPDEKRITAIGLGALGSQLVTKLIRAGYGTWSFVDEDFLLPHNVVRHELSSQAVGFLKAPVMMQWANSLLECEIVTDAIRTNVIHPGKEAGRLRDVLEKADVIADFSASVAVGRLLAREENTKGRRVAAFLNPRGTDLVVLSEDVGRKIPMDCLEMQYYRAIFRNPELNSHLGRAVGRTRYAQSCRDLTSTIPEDLVSLHASIGSRALRWALGKDSASLGIWSADESLAVEHVNINVTPIQELRLGDWLLCADEDLLRTVLTIRHNKLPNETGGVLLGSFDLDRHIVYVVDTIPSPPDSIERPMAYIRGCQGLLEAVHKVEEKTGGMLQYVGEWHSHPDDISLEPSEDDRAEFEWLAGYMQADGLIPVMLISGQNGQAWFLHTME
jgi:integrative and conjugative element protein (TIGR02256 family)